MKELTIQDLRMAHQKNATRRMPLPPGGPQPPPEPPMPPLNNLNNINDELEISAFMQEVQKIKEEEILEQELTVPRPIEPLEESETEEIREEDKEKEDERCQNHCSDSTLYAWRETFTLRADPKKEITKENDPKYEAYLEELDDEKAARERDKEDEIYGISESDNFGTDW